ncbi:hypothetical protein TNCT_652221 [Trichonephila clavata]|uniref:Uncharacterized protein n=1 Tax=Trichonephila clavata TaxID=2740835 RepID=A0A8X6K9W1_TRICU|nr:hypothetical protein TNCT_652221 [Trichonephila clavata]
MTCFDTTAINVMENLRLLKKFRSRIFFKILQPYSTLISNADLKRRQIKYPDKVIDSIPDYNSQVQVRIEIAKEWFNKTHLLYVYDPGSMKTEHLYSPSITSS